MYEHLQERFDKSLDRYRVKRPYWRHCRKQIRLGKDKYKWNTFFVKLGWKCLGQYKDVYDSLASRALHRTYASHIMQYKEAEDFLSGVLYGTYYRDGFYLDSNYRIVHIPVYIRNRRNGYNPGKEVLIKEWSTKGFWTFELDSWKRKPGDNRFKDKWVKQNYKIVDTVITQTKAEYNKLTALEDKKYKAYLAKLPAQPTKYDLAHKALYGYFPWEKEDWRRRKKKIEEENNYIRDRHGFDDNSFKGRPTI